MFEGSDKMMLVAVLVGVLVLLYKSLKPSLTFSSEGMYPGSTLAMLGTERSDGYATSGYLTRNTRNNLVEGMYHEPPVFWNAGDLAASQAAVNANMGSAEGMRSRRADYVEGMKPSKFSDAALSTGMY